MQSITDGGGRRWSISLNTVSNRRVKAIVGLDLFGVADGDLLQRLCDEPALAVEVVYAMLSEDIKAAGITEEEFGSGLAPCIDAVQEALINEIVLFFPKQKRDLFHAARKSAEDEASKAGAEVLAAMDAAVRTKVRESLGRLRQQSGI